MNRLERNTVKSAEELTKHIETLNITKEQTEKLNHLILKHVDDCIRWGIQVKLGHMLEELEEAEK